MRTAKLYRVTEHVVAVHEGQNYFSVVPKGALYPYNSYKALMPVEADFQRDDLPIQEVCVDKHGRRETFYFAVDRELERILSLPFADELRIAKESQAKALSNARDLQRIIAKFNDLPWFKRVWIALTSSV